MSIARQQCDPDHTPTDAETPPTPVRHSIFRRRCMCEFYVAKSETWLARIQRLGKLFGVAHPIFGKSPTP
jgi:hypothetical protein